MREMEASIKSINAKILKAVITSPINGILVKKDLSVGEVVSPNVPVISVISKSKFKIESNVPEVDIAKVSIGDYADITLDAYGDDVKFDAVVSKIDPSETVIEGLPTYKVTLQFVRYDDRIMPGMTANIEIITDFRNNAIVVPYRVIISKDSGQFVRVFDDFSSSIKEVEVKTGIRSLDGMVEIIQGIKDGDKIILNFD